MTDQDPRAIFLHIYKTGTTTLTSIIRRRYSPEEIFEIDDSDVPGSLQKFLELEPDVQSRVRVIQGHHPFGLHAAIPYEWQYIALLRDPVERIMSHYHYVIRTPTLRQHREIVDAKMTLKDYVTKTRPSRFFNNGQVRYLCGPNFLKKGVATRESLQRAMENAQRHFAVVGTTSRFDESLMLLKRHFDWDWPVYERQQVSPVKRSKEELSPDELDVILETNALDLELYEFVRGRFEDRLSREPSSFWSELRKFRKLQASFADRKKKQRFRIRKLLGTLVSR